LEAWCYNKDLLRHMVPLATPYNFQRTVEFTKLIPAPPHVLTLLASLSNRGTRQA